MVDDVKEPEAEQPAAGESENKPDGEDAKADPPADEKAE